MAVTVRNWLVASKSQFYLLEQPRNAFEIDFPNAGSRRHWDKRKNRKVKPQLVLPGTAYTSGTHRLAQGRSICRHLQWGIQAEHSAHSGRISVTVVDR